MRPLLTRLAILVLLLVAAATALLLLATDSKPLVERSEVISPNSIFQAKRLFDANDPRRHRSGEMRTVAIPAALIDEGVNYAAGRYAGGRGAFALQSDAGEVRFSIALPGKRFVNLQARIAPIDGKPRIDSASIGALPLPGALIEFAITATVTAYGFSKEWQLAAQSIRNVAFVPAVGMVAVTYVWQPTILDQARAIAMQEDDIKRLQVAQAAFAGLVAHRATGSQIPLSEVLKTTLPDAGDAPSLQGRATLLVLASYLADKDLAALVPAARNWPRIRRVNITLAGRHDLAQHFVVSAALAAWAGEPAADAIGIYKELHDARNGSGFSFIDLSADRAGTRFGEALIKNPQPLFSAMKSEFVDAQLLPDVTDLPEGLYRPEFNRRFGNHQSAQFQAMQQEIERRLDTLPLYRP